MEVLTQPCLLLRYTIIFVWLIFRERLSSEHQASGLRHPFSRTFHQPLYLWPPCQNVQDPVAQVPFPELHGEFTKYVGRAEDAVIAMSSYRLHVKFKESIVNVPLQLLESVECRDMFQLHIMCKDCKVIRCKFSTFEQCQKWLKRLSLVTRPPSQLEELFSFAFHAWCMDSYSSEKEQHNEHCRPGDHVISRFHSEVKRMGFDTQKAWRISELNDKYKLCSSYPQLVVVPAWVTDKELENVAAFRSWKRFPAVVYRHQSTGTVIARCSQPEVSWWGWRNADDEHLVQAIARACSMDSSSNKTIRNRSFSCDFQNGPDLSDVEFDSSMTNSSEVDCLAIQPHKLLILDARSYAAAVANRAKGGGCECPEYYPNCEVLFMGMANIHSIRKSFQSLRILCAQMPDPANWLSALESTKWLQHLSLLLKAALLVVSAVDRDHRPVLVHCSDGWDRTPQIVALSKLLLDPYYRTIEGFQVLVEMEWLDFGHKFADRCGHGENAEDLNERCPVFLQWLDCVHQLQRQFPCSFEFTEAFLVKLVQHTYSCLFGTFLCNSKKEREDQHIQERTCSVWSLLHPANRSFKNMLYSSLSETVLHPVYHVRNLMLWTAVYLPCSSPTTPYDESCVSYDLCGANPEGQPLFRHPKTRSFDNLPSACEAGNSLPPNRRSSDPSLNEKWQEHRRSLELSIMAGTDGTRLQGTEEWPNGQLVAGLNKTTLHMGTEECSQAINCVRLLLGEGVEAELSVDMAMGQIENILQEATADSLRDAKAEHANNHVISNDTENQYNTDNDLTVVERNGVAYGFEVSKDDYAEDDSGESLTRTKIINVQCSVVNEKSCDSVGQSFHSPDEVKATEYKKSVQIVLNKCTTKEAQNLHSSFSLTCAPPTAIKNVRNGYGEEVNNEHKLLCPLPKITRPVTEVAEILPSVLESSTETLTEDLSIQSETFVPLAISAQPKTEPTCLKHSPESDPEPQSTSRMQNGTCKQPSLSGLRLSFASAKPLHSMCNGDTSEPVPSTPQRALLSLNSSSSVQCCMHSGRSHLDDDGLSLHTDAMQQRLLQIEAGHQFEVEALKRQVQELWSQLQSQHAITKQRSLNGDLGNEMTSVADINLDPNCLSHCNTELFSETSWEQVDRQDTEVTRWYPDHLAAQCYGCERGFWLVTRKHHCRRKDCMEEAWYCGNVFCASCCDQKIPVPSQQLFEPSRVCKTCYNSLQSSAPPLDLEFDKSIMASSN
ncbi:myotubularin-related protein 3 isoform X4 [Hemibagrus wyckioides]|uniref:myotubularin-related protein 3 isoform X4 n=1 Tax=Hemibagrus wyckioides TaxID=337641 RepID=UPI00266CD33A|nr:myotubularin-related protein 3 isoform X4 [Hemibagrus wyckioides]